MVFSKIEFVKNLMIQNYNPPYINNTSQLIEAVKSLICPYIGKTLKATWIGWMNDYDCWWEEMPIILQIGEDQVEICWTKFEDVAVTKNQIPLDGAMQLTEGASIKKDVHEILNKFIGKRVTGVEVGESTMSVGNSGDIWIPNSINFIFGEAFLMIYNGLDENGISDKRPDEHILRSYPICSA